MAEHAESGMGAIRDGAHQIRHDLSRDQLEERVEGAMKEKPLLRWLLDLRVLLRAVLVAAVLTLIAALLFSPPFGGVVLVLSFVGAWLILAHREHSRRRPTKPAREDEEEAEATA